MRGSAGAGAAALLQTLQLFESELKDAALGVATHARRSEEEVYMLWEAFEEACWWGGEGGGGGDGGGIRAIGVEGGVAVAQRDESTVAEGRSGDAARLCGNSGGGGGESVEEWWGLGMRERGKLFRGSGPIEVEVKGSGGCGNVEEAVTT